MDRDELKRAARELTRTAFVSRFEHPFLIVGEIQEEKDVEFQTHVPVSLSASSKDPATLARAALREVSGIFPVVKSARNPYQDRISIGRAKTCDMVLQTRYMSKLHAHFLRNTDGTWELRDANSSNGTFRNGERLPQNQKMPIRGGDRLRFGFLDAQFLDAGGLYDVLRR
jgi:hypothetical protein